MSWTAIGSAVAHAQSTGSIVPLLDRELVRTSAARAKPQRYRVGIQGALGIGVPYGLIGAAIDLAPVSWL